MAEEQHESKIGLVKAGSKNPIALYSLIVVVAVSGLITAVTLVDKGFGQNAIILTIAVILIMIVYLVGTRALGKTVEVKERYPSHGETISQTARIGWYYGGNASVLEAPGMSTGMTWMRRVSECHTWSRGRMRIW